MPAMKNPRPFFAAFAVLLVALWPGLSSAVAQGLPLTLDSLVPPVTAKAVVMADQAHVGSPTAIAVVIDIAETYHINPDPPRSGPEWFPGQFPTTLKLIDPPAGVSVGAVQYPEPKPYMVEYADQEILVYEGQVVLYVPLLLAPEIETGALDLQLELEVQACDPQVCLMPETFELSTTIEVVSLGTAIDSVDESSAEVFSAFDAAGWALIDEGAEAPPEAVEFDLFGWDFSVDPQGVGLILLLVVAAFGGLLLNFTPCVLPVIPIKVMSLNQSGGGRGRTLLLGLAMAFGVVGFWMVIGGAIAFISGFGAINELFQRPWFTIGVGVVIAVMAVGMCGLFAVKLPRFVYQVSPKHDSVSGSVGFGVMTAVLSTPCTAPFMGTAAAWATTQPSGVTLGTFAAIGAGMALPYLVLSAFPELVDRMPRTGPGSELIKQVMGLLMLAAAMYFLGVGWSAVTHDPPEVPSRAYWWAVAAFVAAAGGWLIFKTWRITTRPAKRGLWGAVGLAAIALSLVGARSFTDGGPIAWVMYTPERLAELRADDQIVVMDFTAEWCLNCKALEQSVLYSERVAALDDAADVTFVKVDLTSHHNVEGKAKLASVGRVTIPALVIFDGRGEEVFNGDFYTIEQVLGAVDQARDRAAVVRR
ncbi:MAG: cytochrome c biogenesis protein CcdA [Planctomycetota bacterium]